MNQSKPEPIVINMQGIEAEPITFGSASLDLTIDWNRVIQYPPFQMYAYEKTNLSIENVENWIIEFTINNLEELGEKSFFDSYESWHKGKGYWKDEDAMGNLI
ncbi:hypothetical protein [uncultured Acinetobacter sp.]|uniref:hypothetical protein n=1 Tax=uncultured Acinetobacter sp. TaxID=165433 RepID=UPI00258B5CE3|nr:hypothetical protein [uncultured Acinetobacter sp.]